MTDNMLMRSFESRILCKKQNSKPKFITKEEITNNRANLARIFINKHAKEINKNRVNISIKKEDK